MLPALCLIVVFVFSFKFFCSLLTPAPYYAIFFTNGQVYFGHIEQLDNATITLNDVYYFRTDSNPSQSILQAKKKVDLHIALVKLGNEIHEPKDTLYINRQQVLFWEELNGQGKLAQALKKYKSLQ